MIESFAQLETPALLVDLDLMHANIRRTAEYAATHGLHYRPHVKTHKSSWVAAQQVEAGASGLTCATPREAEVMSAVTPDLLLAYPVIGETRIRRIAELASRTSLRVMLDSTEALAALARTSALAGRDIGVLVELDVGMHRTGVSSVEDAVALARRAADTAGLRWLGIGCYPGHIRTVVDGVSPELSALSSRIDATIAALTAAGLPPSVVSAGSTPTLWQSHHVAGLTEIRPGTSVYNDRTTAAIGGCTIDECALTVLATVISVAVSGQAVVDAGTKALGREPIRGVEAPGFGVLHSHPDVIVSAMSEEHGMLDLSGTPWRPRIGDRVRIIPNHVCIVVHLADRVHGIRGGEIITSWEVEARGREATAPEHGA
ncbi:MAG: alanine racemase [Gemmatimonadota bacterium]